MTKIRTFLGRRQFLMAAGMASTCALTCKKLTGFRDRSANPAAAMAAEKAAAATIEKSVSRCPHLLSPLRIRNVMLKNRIMHTVSPPYLLQGPENHPTDAYRNHYSNMAKNAAIVSISTSYGPYPRTWDEETDYSQLGYHFSNNTWQKSPTVYNYVQRMIEDIHCEGALVLFAGDTGSYTGLGPTWGPGIEGSHKYDSMAEAQAALAALNGTDVDTATGSSPGAGGAGGPGGGTQGQPSGGSPAAGPGGRTRKTLSIEEVVAEAKEVEANGYDVYRLGTASVEAAQAVRNATNLILMSSLRVGSGGMGGMGGMGGGKNPDTPGVSNDNQPSADDIEKAVESARELEGIVDYVMIRADEHPNSFVQDKDKPKSLAYSEAIKAADIDLITCPCSGFHDPVQNDEFIAGGKADMIGMTTPFFADPELVEKVAAGRADDVIPCIQCQNCHGISKTNGPYYQSCTVNPKWAAPVYKLQNIHVPKMLKKVAVIGGGPAGMKAAIVASERGHMVTLYEKSDALGGLLKISDQSRWRWNHKDLKDYLIHQVEKAGVDVKLKTAATPGMIRAEGYDTVLVATGAEPVISKMRGADADNVFTILECYSNKTALGKNVVVIGAGKFGTEAGVGMAKDGHKVTVLTTGKYMIEPEAIGPHNVCNQEDIYKNHPDFNYETEVMVKNITGGKVTYTDSKGVEKFVPADSIVIYSGLKPRMDEAEKFLGSADQVLTLGDCTGKNGTLQLAIRSAFFMASQV